MNHDTSNFFLQAEEIANSVRSALLEDIGSGDISAALIPETATARARLISREAVVLCGAAWFERVFLELDASIEFTWHARDGEDIHAGQVLCELQGSARALLTAERTALNFLQTLSGTATLARRYAEAVEGTGIRVLDTRKTLPGLRLAQKYAVACGGCHNHRRGLYDAVLIKENHIRAAGSLSAVIAQAKATAPKAAFIEVEVSNLAELREALLAGAERILLDNFSLSDLSHAVTETAGRALLESSGGVTLETIRTIADTGVDFISVGGLTKDVKAVDLSLLFDVE